MLIATLLQLAALAASPLPLDHAPARGANSDLIHKYLNAVRMQDLTGRGVDREVTIRASLPKLNKQATLRALRSTSPSGKITYGALDSGGDKMVKREVIARYLAAENQGLEMDQIAITPSHYRFRLTRAFEQAGRHIQVVQLTPKKKRLGLFKGELWLDAQTGLPVHEAGRFVRSPSVFVRQVVFVRDYQIRDGLALPDHIEVTVETRLVGRAELRIEFSNFVFHENHNLSREEYQKCQ